MTFGTSPATNAAVGGVFVTPAPGAPAEVSALCPPRWGKPSGSGRGQHMPSRPSPLSLLSSRRGPPLAFVTPRNRFLERGGYLRAGGGMLYQCACSTRVQKKTHIFKETEMCFIFALLTLQAW